MGATQVVITVVWFITIMLVYFVLYLALNYATCCWRRVRGADGGAGEGVVSMSSRRRNSILSALIDSDSEEEDIGDVV